MLEPDQGLTRPAGRVRASVCEGDAYKLFHYRYGDDVVLTSTEATDFFWVSIPCSLRRQADGWARIDVVDGESRLAAPGREDPMRVAGGQDRLGLALPHQRLQDFADNVLQDPSDVAHGVGETFDLRVPSHRAIGWLIAQMVEEDAADADFVTDQSRVEAYLDAIVATILIQCRRSSEPPAQQAPRDVALVTAYMVAHLDEPIRLRDLVAVAQVSARTLSAHFTAEIGMAPMAYLSDLRLRHARALLEGGAAASVTAAALASGLTHLGRFSQRYAARFGEVPSATLARATGH
ncbi:AraC family transcriptional regulator [Rhodobacteraceae bacterium N5(2021)]|uniref:AraC family transcriptional regulator n=2 Tax=Gymnodinialimonas phycosphaerae TaxID=2841589 RepID=A0A975TZ44_9RHOB|nr:AraC family transcriptional regulator [Gymnodinialimonas phycosphaerae]